MTCLWTIVLGVITFFLSIYLYFQYAYTYWTRKNVNFAAPKFPFGNFQGINRKYSIGQLIRNIYEAHQGQLAVGIWIFAKPAIVLRDLELIKTVLIKEFPSFSHRGTVQASEYDPLTGKLYYLFTIKRFEVDLK